jgi:methionyl-tRNA synthetase
VLADAITRFQRLAGQTVYFLTGVDQHGQKVQQTAEKAGVTPQAYVTEITSKFLALWERLEVKYDGWVETTDPRHVAIVQSLLQQLHDSGQLYKKNTRRFYSTRQEQDLTDKDRNEEGNFGPEWGEVVELDEENWYFKLTDHLPWLRAYLKENADTVFPANRLSQLVNATEGEGMDLCISRPKSRLTWGIELPFDRDYVTYVWFDALTNYISFAGFRDASPSTSGLPDFSKTWQGADVVHVIGKDILIPAHGIYWLIMLHACGFPDADIPRLLVHGWWNARGEKMSKSLGNVIDPNAIADTIGTDALRYFLLAEIATGQDSDMSDERVLFRNNKELADILGNLLNRTLNMAKKYLGGQLRHTGFDSDAHTALREKVAALPAAAVEYMKTWQIQKVLVDVIDTARMANEFIDQTAPFKLAKDPANADQVASIMGHIAEAMAHLSVLLSPVMPTAAAKIQQQLGWTPPVGFLLSDLKWGLLPDGHTLGEPSPIFPKILPPPA